MDNRRFTVALLALAALTAGCGKKTNQSRDERQETRPAAAQSEPARPNTVSCKIAAIVPSEAEFYQLNQLGMTAAAKKYGAELKVGTTSGSISEEASLVSICSSGVDAIVIAPLNSDSSVEALRRAHELGVKVITYDRSITAPFPEASVEGNDVDLGASVGRAVADYVTKRLGGKATLALIGLSQPPELGKMRSEGFRKEIERLPGVVVVTEKDVVSAPEAMAAVSDILMTYPDLDIVWAADEQGTVGAVGAVRMAGKAGRTVVFGTHISRPLADLLLDPDNVLQAVSGWKPYDMGFHAVETAVKLVRNEQTPRKIVIPPSLYSRDQPEELKRFVSEFPSSAELAAMLAATTPIAVAPAGSQAASSPPIEFTSWKLGSQFNLAVVLTQRSKKAELTKQIYDDAQKLAAAAGVEIPQLPEKGELPDVLAFLDQTNRTLEKEIAEKHGRKAELFFELASMPMVWLLVYDLEDEEINNQFLTGIIERVDEAQLPGELFEPAVRIAREKGSIDALRQAVLEMDERVTEYLRQPHVSSPPG